MIRAYAAVVLAWEAWLLHAGACACRVGADVCTGVADWALEVGE